MPQSLSDTVDAVATESRLAGVVRVDRDGVTELERGYGFAHRALEIPNTPETQLAVASGSKALTALAVVSLIEEGVLEPATIARSLLGDDLPLIDDTVTVEHLLAHRSGIGDYIDEEDDEGEITDYVLSVPLHELAETEKFLPMLDGFPQKFAPDERFSYCNSGYVVLALIAERASRTPFHDLIEQRVCARAGLDDTKYLRSDELPARAALGYLTMDSPRTNVLHLPVRGNGDGGVYTTVADVHRLWSAFLSGAIVSPTWVAEMIRPRSDVPEESMRYGLGFWLHASTDAVILVGYDAGASFRTVHDPTTQLTHTVISNWSDGAWPTTRKLSEVLESS